MFLFVSLVCYVSNYSILLLQLIWIYTWLEHLEDLLLKQHVKIKVNFTFNIQWYKIYSGVFKYNSPNNWKVVWWIWSNHMCWNYGDSCCDWWHPWDTHCSGLEFYTFIRQVSQASRLNESDYPEIYGSSLAKENRNQAFELDQFRILKGLY